METVSTQDWDFSPLLLAWIQQLLKGQAQTQTGSNSFGNPAPLIDGTPAAQQVATGRVPGGSSGQQCCCVPANEVCSDPFGGDDLVGGGFTRIVNRPVANTNSQQNTCPVGQKACCY